MDIVGEDDHYAQYVASLHANCRDAITFLALATEQIRQLNPPAADELMSTHLGPLSAALCNAVRLTELEATTTNNTWSSYTPNAGILCELAEDVRHALVNKTSGAILPPPGLGFGTFVKAVDPSAAHATPYLASWGADRVSTPDPIPCRTGCRPAIEFVGNRPPGIIGDRRPKPPRSDQEIAKSGASRASASPARSWKPHAGNGLHGTIVRPDDCRPTDPDSLQPPVPEVDRLMSIRVRGLTAQLKTLVDSLEKTACVTSVELVSLDEDQKPSGLEACDQLLCQCPTASVAEASKITESVQSDVSTCQSQSQSQSSKYTFSSPPDEGARVSHTPKAPSWASVARLSSGTIPSKGPMVIPLEPRRPPPEQRRPIGNPIVSSEESVQDRRRVIWITNVPAGTTLARISAEIHHGPIMSIVFSPDALPTLSACVIFQHASSAEAVFEDHQRAKRRNGLGLFARMSRAADEPLDLIHSSLYARDENIMSMERGAQRRLRFARGRLLAPHGIPLQQFIKDAEDIVHAHNIELIHFYNSGDATIIFASVELAAFAKAWYDQLIHGRVDRMSEENKVKARRYKGVKVEYAIDLNHHRPENGNLKTQYWPNGEVRGYSRLIHYGDADSTKWPVVPKLEHGEVF